MTRFLAPLLLIVLAPPALALEHTTPPSAPFTQGKYIAYAETWSKWSDPANKEGFDPMLLDDARFPRQVKMTWHNPDHGPVKAGVWGYGYVGYGQYDYHAAPGVAPVQMKSLKSLRITYDVELTNAANTNLLAEYFLYRDAPRPGVSGTKGAEIGWLLNCPAGTLAYFQTGRQLGQFTDADGAMWQVAVVQDGSASNYVLFIPGDGKPRLSGSLDMASALPWLKEKGVVQDAMWWSGVALGVEPLQGAGGLVVRDFAVSLN